MILTNLLDDVRFLIEDASLLQDVVRNPLYFSKLACEENGKIIGASLMRVTSEMTWVSTASKYAQVRAFKALLSEQTVAARRFGINQAHVWTDMDAALLRHLGFIERPQKSYILHF
jgi:N-acetylglutamate synthase-like GNAT family acetyltransferase